ncbi:MAG TPA: MFS transporter [Candidatus Corynebacterium avicola]|uniref:MFS transporter n=1 Tax=Candidatus Corynebacterium avicola TaxID=2838527 RepID=A0A9D1UKB9_9CORY|nr:MFS transporter [Candidatus Corynebacterium avicola]
MAFLGWSMLLAVIPVDMLDAGYGDTLAGLATGVFMLATVITQAFVPRVLRGIGYVPVLVGGALMLGVPSALYLVDWGSAVVLLVSAVRGVGFGAVTVAQSALLAELVPPQKLGRANAFFGAAIGLAEIIGFSVGLPLYSSAGDIVYVIAAACGFIGAAGATGVPKLKAAVQRTGDSDDRVHVPLWKLALVPVVGLCTAAMGFGAFSSFTAPSVAEIDETAAATLAGITLAVIGAGQILGRTISGWWSDRVGEPGHVVVWASLFCVGGMLGMTLLLISAPEGTVLVLAVLGVAALFGLGFGAVQSETLLMMFARMPKERVSEASAVWNMSFDTGTGAGSSVLGASASSAGYGGAFLVGAGLVSVGTATLAGDRVMGRHRVVEHNNIRTRLRQLRSGQQ